MLITNEKGVRINREAIKTIKNMRHNGLADRLSRTLTFLNMKWRRLAGIAAWILSAPGILRGVKDRDRRLLAIYDLSSQSFSIGDFILFQEASLVQCNRFSLKYVDIAIVYEPKHPAAADPAFSSITDETVLYHLASILPVAQTNQNLGSLFIFNSHLQLERYLADNAGTYQIWPSTLQYAGKDYLYFGVFNEVLYEYFKDHGNVPYLRCRQFLVDWTSEFYRNNLNSSVPVTVNLRNNKLFHKERNSRMDCWLNFFKHCSGRYPVKFIIVCALAEVDDRMRHLDNVIIAKDFHTNIEQDLALIYTSAMHLGASSGPFTIALFNPKPYLMFSWATDPAMHRGLIHENGFYRFCFATPMQRMMKEPENIDLLIREFAVMFETIEKSQFLNVQCLASDTKQNPLTWLR